MKLLIVAGTRPEIIKLAPLALRARSMSGLTVDLILTGQHEAMAREAMAIFGLEASANLQIMRPNQTLDHVFAAVMTALPPILEERRPDVLVVQGDTTSAVAAALSAFHAKIPVAHVEAGLRTQDLQAPFPEEANRRLLGIVTTFHFCPTESAAANLRNENVPESCLHVPGNTIVDAVMMIRERYALDDLRSIQPDIRAPYVLVTAHRRESFGEGFRNICTALRSCALAHPNLQFIYPVHLNPHVRTPVHEMLGGLRNILLIPPVSYLALLTLLNGAEFVVTDSGGIQEEAPSFGKHCIVMRERTERMESVDAGLSELVGTNVEAITNAVSRAAREGTRHPGVVNPYGDGHASERIRRILSEANTARV